MVFSLWGGRLGWGMGRQGKETNFIKHLPEWLLSKSLQITNVGEDVDKQEL